jgi:hypothetical protein
MLKGTTSPPAAPLLLKERFIQMLAPLLRNVAKLPVPLLLKERLGEVLPQGEVYVDSGRAAGSSPSQGEVR